MPDFTKLSDVVFARLHSQILSGELERGSLHSIYELADTFEMSRTPVREAAVRLADTGLVTIERNRGIRICGLSANEIKNVFEIRLLLEVPGAAHAAALHDPGEIEILSNHLRSMHDAIELGDAADFSDSDYALHDRVLASFGNPRLNEYMHTLRDFTRNMGAVTIEHTRSLLEIGLEHEPIVDAIKAGDSPRAARAMADHLVGTASLLIARADGVPPEEASSDWASPYLAQLSI